MDILVGISAKNVESTIVHVMNVVSLGLMEFFSEYNNLVVVSDGFSTDRTFELAELFGLPDRINKIVTEDHGNSGKGCAIRTIFEIAALSDAKAVVTIDGDLFSIKPDWIQNLVQPCMYGRADLVVPFYVRDKYDGVITNNLAYPYMRSLYGIKVRQPIGGDYGLSNEMVEILRKHPMFPDHFGIDIFITTVASGEHMDISEALLGLKIHESTTKYLEPGKHLIPMFRQVVGTMFGLTEYYEDEWKKTHKRDIKRRIGRYYGQRPVPVKVDLEKIVKTYKADYLNYKEYLASILPEELLNVVEENINSEKPDFKPEHWARTVYTIASKYKRSDKNEKPFILDALRVLWLIRYASYVVETEGMDIDEAERVIEEQARIFEEEKDYLISIY
ncbi:MAG: glycosyltransferase [Candidatus Hydrothermarchaeota archaeon]